MALTEDVKALIEEGIEGSKAEVADEGGGDHLRATVTAKQFSGLSRIEQHKLVKAAAKPRFDDGSIHALSIRTIVVND